ncbi:MAG TPA: ATP-binding protein, partial [Pseudobdellovibrionaceae bacterium]
MIIGRKQEIDELNSDYLSEKSSLIVIYGRRRIGKSALVANYASKKPFLSFEALEGVNKAKQIEHFISQLNLQIKDEFLSQMRFGRWDEVFRYLTEKLKQGKEKQVLFFDEFQWMASGQSSLVSLLKFFWDTEWKKLNVQLILCGSIASFMVDKVIKSKALYGRVDLERVITELRPFELRKFLDKSRSLHEVLKYILVMGGVPKYFELINKNESFEKNIQRLAFNSSGYLFNDYEKIFYAQFKEATTYERIVRFILKKPQDLEDISRHLKMQSSGGVKRYLKNLEAARFIRSYKPIQKANTNVVKYKMLDEYLIFYHKYIQPHHRQIQNAVPNNIFVTKVKSEWTPWLGIAFENFCLKYNAVICEVLGIRDLVEEVGPYFERKDKAGFQIDLLIKRSDHTWVICECKYYEGLVGVEVTTEVEKKINRLEIPRGISVEKVLITVSGA